MFCPNCGCWNPDDSQNCSACATALKAAPAAPVQVSSTSFADRWRKVAASPLLLVLAICISVQAIMNVSGIFDSISLSFDLMGIDFLAGLLTLIIALAGAAIFLAAAGLWLTYLDGIKKDASAVNTTGIGLTILAVLIQLAAMVVTLLSLLVGAESTVGLGALMSIDAGALLVVILVVVFGLVFLYYGLLLGAANGAKKAAETKTPSVSRVGGAAAMSFVFAALSLIGLLGTAVTFAGLLGVAVTAVQGILLMQYKKAMIA